MKHALIVMAFCTLMGQNAFGQVPQAPQPPHMLLNQDTSTTSLTYGSFATTLHYGFQQPHASYNFDEPLRTIMLASDEGAISVGYGTSAADSTSGRGRLRMINATVLTGGNAVLFDELFTLPVRAYVPLRLNVDYMHLTASGDDKASGSSEQLGPVHLLGGGIGLGLGAHISFPIGPKFLKDRIAVRGSYVIVPGVIDNVAPGMHAPRSDETLRDLKLRRATHLNAELLLKDIFDDDSVGITVGYTYRTVHRSLAGPGSIEDVLNAVVGSDDLLRLSTRSIVRIGVNW